MQPLSLPRFGTVFELKNFPLSNLDTAFDSLRGFASKLAVDNYVEQHPDTFTKTKPNGVKINLGTFVLRKPRSSQFWVFMGDDVQKAQKAYEQYIDKFNRWMYLLSEEKQMEKSNEAVEQMVSDIVREGEEPLQIIDYHKLNKGTQLLWNQQSTRIEYANQTGYKTVFWVN